MKLTIFDLDHTLLHGDSDELWCEFLMQEGLLDRAVFAPRNAALMRDYAAGTVSVEAFNAFYIGTLGGRSPRDWAPVRQAFLHRMVVPRLPSSAHALVARHRAAGDRLVLSTATNRFVAESTAAHLGFEHLIATECELAADGCFTGRAEGKLNMREGKVARLHEWLRARGEALAGYDGSRFYSDSINDLPLLSAVAEAVVVNADPKLAATAQARGWPALRLLPDATSP